MPYDATGRECHEVLTPEEMRQTEQSAFDRGVPGILLMEHAAIAVVDALQQALGGSCQRKRVLFLCGTGNNGGDGLAAARLFSMRGGRATVYCTGEPKTNDASSNWLWAHEMGIPIVLSKYLQSEADMTENRFAQGFDGYVDALLGTGLRGAPDEKTAALIEAVNREAKDGLHPVLAVDIPSGMDGKTGEVPGACIHADVTVTFHAPKTGLYLTGHREYVGRLVIADIGLWGLKASGSDSAHPRVKTATPLALKRLRQKKPGDHKGNWGRVLIYAGQLGMAGAAAICAKAAVTAGAGLTTIACDREIIPVLQTLVPNAMCVDIRETVENPPTFDVLALGCGLGQRKAVWENILRLWDPSKKSVWDADALNLLAEYPIKLGGQAVITPHPGEAARLLHCSVQEVLRNRLEAAKALSEAYACTAALKSDVTVIYGQDMDGSPAFRLNTVGSPALAKGGSGDALTGIIAAELTYHSPVQAAEMSCLWHGMAGIAGAERYGVRELTTDQLISCMKDAEEHCNQL